MKFKKLKIIINVLVLFFAWFGVARGTEIFFDPSSQEIKPGDYFQIDLLLDAQSEEINAIEGKIIIPENLIEVQEILDGDSIINLWIEKPTFVLKEKSIVFGGVIPGGFKGVLSPFHQGYEAGKIFSVIFKTKNETENLTEGQIKLKDVKILKNDGLGTEARLLITNFQFKINKEAPTIEGFLPIKDPDKPELFEPIISEIDNKWFLVFITQDKGSGIDYYAVYESLRKKEITQISAKDWVKAESPYLLKDQKLGSYIYVKSVDKAGNERVVALLPKNPTTDYKNYIFLVIIILTITIVYIIKEKKKT